MKYLASIFALVLAGCGSSTAPIATAPVVTTQTPPPVVATPPVVTAPPPTADIQPSGADDSVAIQALLNAGGRVVLGAGTFHLTHTLTIGVNGTTLEGAGQSATTLEFTPPPAGSPRGVCTTDRVITPRCGLSTTLQLQIADGIAVGDTSFTATNASDVADLSPGDWVIITINDLGIADGNTHLGYPTYVDWEQVASVHGTTVNVVTPFRMAFPNTLPFVQNSSGLGFVRALPTGENVTIQDLTILVDATVNGNPTAGAAGIYMLGTLNTTVSHVTINNPDAPGDTLYTEETKGTTITDCNLIGSKYLNEFAESVDLTITGSTFSNQGLAVGLDLGTGFFTFSGNTITHSVNVALYAIYHVHDGIIEGNTIDAVTFLSGYTTIGVELYGSPDVTVSNNSITGNNSAGSIGIEAEGDGNAHLPEPSTGDTATDNTITEFASATSIN
jgi:hypothetical protein